MDSTVWKIALIRHQQNYKFIVAYLGLNVLFWLPRKPTSPEDCLNLQTVKAGDSLFLVPLGTRSPVQICEASDRYCDFLGLCSRVFPLHAMCDVLSVAWLQFILKLSAILHLVKYKFDLYISPL